MKFCNKKIGFTLAEIMVVALILTIIFAAFAPLITTKKRSTVSAGSVWSWHGNAFTAGPMDAYYNPGDPTYTGEVFFGITPKSKAHVTDSLKPLAKLVIRGGGVTSDNKVQRQIMFRYGRSSTSDKGAFAGTWFADGKNMLLGGEYPFTNIKADEIEAVDNTAIGYQALSGIRTGKANTALGAYALNKVTSGSNNTVLGAMAGKNIADGVYNTFAGANAGENITGSYNTIFGYGAGTGNGSASVNYNVFMGYNAGHNVETGSYNTAIGAHALEKITTGSFNTAIGYGALQNLTTGSYNVALGSNACQFVTEGSYKTCIGAKSGPSNSDSNSETKYLKAVTGKDARTDDQQRTYIGTSPWGSYGGSAVLEIHNVTGSNSGLINDPSIKSNVTTVINGNLVIKGRPFFTTGDTLYYWNNWNVWSSHTNSLLSHGNGDNKCATNQTNYVFTQAAGGTRFADSYCPNLQTSDRRLKNIESKNTAGLDEINKLKVYNYTFKNDKDKKPYVGVMAQDLAKVFPTAVFKDANGYLKIRWDEMFFASINAIKQLDKKIVSLIDRTTKVEVQIAQLEKENTSLKTQVASLTARVEKLKNK